MSEIWRDIVGYEGLYQISNEGKVKSLARDVEWRGTIRHQPEQIKKLSPDRDGYLLVGLSKDGKPKSCKVHRLVASAFIENPDGLPEVNHIDENKTNNSVENLEWVTHKENINHGTHNQRMAETLSIPIDMLTKDDELICSFPSSMETMRWLRANGFPSASQCNITNCCKGYRSIAYGFKWRYAQGN